MEGSMGSLPSNASSQLGLSGMQTKPFGSEEDTPGCRRAGNSFPSISMGYLDSQILYSDQLF